MEALASGNQTFDGRRDADGVFTGISWDKS